MSTKITRALKRTKPNQKYLLVSKDKKKPLFPEGNLTLEFFVIKEVRT
jgi:hypothetical protein